MGRVRMSQNSSPRKSNFGTLTMYKTFYKSQKRIQNYSPKNAVKKKAELIVQEFEDQKYKMLEKELKRSSLDQNQMRYLYSFTPIYYLMSKTLFIAKRSFSSTKIC